MRLPMQSNCNQDDPREANQWLFVDLQFGPNQPYTPDQRMLPDWSERVSDAGFVHVDNVRKLADANGMVHVDQLPKQKLRYRPPYRGQQHTLNHGVWVPMDEKDPEPFAVPDPAEFTSHEQEAMAERLYHTGVLKREDPKPEGAQAVRAPFNPADHTPSSVNTYLEYCADDHERRRVIAAEMTGKKRQQVLRNPKWKGL